MVIRLAGLLRRRRSWESKCGLAPIAATTWMIPWGDEALALHFENPREAAQEIARAFSDGVAGEKAVDAVLALGDRPTVTAAYAAEALGIAGNSPAAAETLPEQIAAARNASGGGRSRAGLFFVCDF